MYTRKNPVENKPTRRYFLREPGEDMDSTGSVTAGCAMHFTHFHCQLSLFKILGPVYIEVGYPR